MENEVKETLEEGMTTETGKLNGKKSKAIIVGGVAIASMLLFKFRNKINAKIENAMVKKLTKKGYNIQSPKETEAFVEGLFDELG